MTTRRVTSVIESLGVYLPPRQVGTREILDGCAHHVRIPLERLTGIRSRHRAGETEFSIDLAAHAIADCLQCSHARAEDFDLLICANISRYDGPRRVSYEPSTAVKLRKKFGFTRAVVMDLSNACAGVWTAVYMVDALIRSGAIQRGMVVSGEYISYLTDTAQKEIVDYLDPQVASLTLGDSGVAVSLQASHRPDVGFQDLELFTLGKYSKFCIAKPSDQPHGGAAMYTDAVNVTASVVQYAAEHADELLQRNQRGLERIHHIIPHQTSRLTMQEAVKEFSNRYAIDLRQRLINNLAERGNTATTSHMVALWDSIRGGRVVNDDEILFLISGSGQTTGTALYKCDDLPDRLRAAGQPPSANGAERQEPAIGETLKVPLCVKAIGVAEPNSAHEPDTLEMLTAASTKCLQQAALSSNQVELLLSVGVYRSEFITEPAIAALLAGELQMNHDRLRGNEPKTLAFDILNGPLGFLNACYVATEMAAAGCLEHALVVASEVENNRGPAPHDLLGLREIGTATILGEAEDGQTGFQAFGFYYFHEYQQDHVVSVLWNPQGRPYLDISRQSNLWQTYLHCIEQGVSQFLREQHLSRDEIQLLLPPQISTGFVWKLAERLGFSEDAVVNVAVDGMDLATSSTPVSLQAVWEQQRARPGDLGLIVNVGSGVQVACALYQF